MQSRRWHRKALAGFRRILLENQPIIRRDSEGYRLVWKPPGLSKWFRDSFWFSDLTTFKASQKMDVQFRMLKS